MANRETARTTKAPNGAQPGRKAATPKAATPWGPAAVIEEAKVTQRVGDRRFASIVQLLENDRGESLIRLAYTTDGVARRGPVTLRPKDLERLRASLGPGSSLAAALGWSTSERPAWSSEGGDA
jgi:hypothetical protein